MKDIKINGKYYYVFVNKIFVAKVNELSPNMLLPHYNISLFKDEDMLDFFINLDDVFSDYLYSNREDAEEELKDLLEEQEVEVISNINKSLDNVERKLKYDKRYKKLFIEKFRYLFEGSDNNESDN